MRVFPLSFRAVEACEVDQELSKSSVWALDVFLRQVAEIAGFEKNGIAIENFCLKLQTTDCPATPIARMIADQQRVIGRSGAAHLKYTREEVERNLAFLLK
jgi:hypothetical protein